MSALTEINLFWQSNSDLQAAVPYSQVYTYLAPEELPFPFAVITPIANVPDFTTGAPYIDVYTFRISIFATDPDEADILGEQVAAQFDYKAISAACISMIRQSGPLTTVDEVTPKRVYVNTLEYEYTRNARLAS